MIFIKLIGGLGNQMFQYALGRHLAIKNGTKLKLDISELISGKGEITIRNYELDQFKIEEEIASPSDLVFFETNKIVKAIEKFKPYHRRLKVYEKGLSFDEKILKIKGVKYLNGFWQSELYFNDIRDVLLKEFSLKNEVSKNVKEISDKIKKQESVSLHVRRGDYVHKYSDQYHVQGNDYYHTALEIIKKVNPNYNLFVFSDDIEWCKTNLIFENQTFYIEPNKSFEDIYLMSLCSHNIIANSSFSWWGAWLNPNPEKICIAPKNWFKNKKQSNNNIIPRSWITI